MHFLGQKLKSFCGKAALSLSMVIKIKIKHEHEFSFFRFIFSYRKNNKEDDLAHLVIAQLNLYFLLFIVI